MSSSDWLATLKQALESEINMPGIDPAVFKRYFAVAEMAAYGCEDEEIAASIGQSASSFEKARKKDLCLNIAIKLGSDFGRAQLRKRQYLEALSGNSNMMGHLGKHILKQSDKNKTDTRAAKVDIIKLGDIRIKLGKGAKK